MERYTGRNRHGHTKKHLSYAGHPYLSGDITATRFDLTTLDLMPLKLTEQGMWDPDDEYWGEEDEPIEDWAKEINGRGLRPEYEMEQVVPGKPEDFDIDTDPILQAIELKDAGDQVGADQALTALLIADLRCLDAHAHFGNLEFDRWPEVALRHYNVGRQIGGLSLGPDFQGVLRWCWIDNRPYLRCLHGYGLWRLSRFDEAAAVFTRMLWMNPPDNQGARFNLANTRDGTKWESSGER